MGTIIQFPQGKAIYSKKLKKLVDEDIRKIIQARTKARQNKGVESITLSSGKKITVSFVKGGATLYSSCDE